MIPLKTLFVFLFLFSLIAFSTHSLAADFAVGNWGDSHQKIIDTETRENFTPPGNQNFIAYKAQVSIFKQTNIVYLFENSLLSDGYFDFLDEHILFQDYVEDYLVIQKQLSKKYKLPKTNEQIWYPDAQILSKDQWGSAIANDDLILKSIWQTPNSLITLQLSYQYNRIHHLLSYRSKRPEIDVITPDDF
ncbi:MAG: hypothetical protein HRU38_09435 [Saccharospirillaceae bacterium]|nr:hypothetical protein [Pseudomonadales bacterium]NRB78876.1 hypothetical protein [Saccharospirillaceae bacterium]